MAMKFPNFWGIIYSLSGINLHGFPGAYQKTNMFLSINSLGKRVNMHGKTHKQNWKEVFDDEAFCHGCFAKMRDLAITVI